MPTIQVTPTNHAIFNDFDRFGLLLGLPRIELEKNPQYKQRLLDIFVNRADSTYRGLINGITRELGLSIQEVINIQPTLDTNGVPKAAVPAVLFSDTKCYLYEDYSTGTLLDTGGTIDRFDTTDDNAYTYTELVAKINAATNGGVQKYAATLISGIDGTTKAMTIFNQSSAILVAEEEISGAGSHITLLNTNLIPKTVSVIAPNFTRRVSTENSISIKGDYYVDLESGNIISNTNPGIGAFVRYKYRNDNFNCLASPIIIHNIQSEDFKTKMFQRVFDELSNEYDGLPTALGADLINEILSVFPSLWGT